MTIDRYLVLMSFSWHKKAADTGHNFPSVLNEDIFCPGDERVSGGRPSGPFSSPSSSQFQPPNAGLMVTAREGPPGGGAKQAPSTPQGTRDHARAADLHRSRNDLRTRVRV